MRVATNNSHLALHKEKSFVFGHECLLLLISPINHPFLDGLFCGQWVEDCWSFLSLGEVNWLTPKTIPGLQERQWWPRAEAIDADSVVPRA